MDLIVQHPYLACAAVFIGGIYTLSFFHRGTSKLVSFVTTYPAFIVLLSLERKLFPGLYTFFPSTIEGLTGDGGKKFATLLRQTATGRRALEQAGVSPQTALPTAAARDAALSAEPRKARSAGLVTLQFGGGKTLSAFVKVPGNRIQPMWILSMIYAFADNPREVDVCRDMMGELEHGRYWQGVRFSAIFAPKPLIALNNRFAGRSLMAWETLSHDDYCVVPDHQGLNAAQMRLMLTMSARFHAKNWRQMDKADPKKFAPWLLDRKPVDFLGYVDLVKGKLAKKIKYFGPLWDAAQAYFNKRSVPTVVGHNDFRSGNMMFRKRTLEKLRADVDVSDDAWFANELQKEDLAVLDWEICGASPMWYDVGYSMMCSMAVEERRKHMPTLLRAYLEELKRCGVPASELCSVAEAQREVYRVMMLIPGNCEALVAIGAVGETWGNSDEDGLAWGVRTSAFVLDASEDVDGICAALGLERWVIEALREDWKKRLTAFEDEVKRRALEKKAE